MKMISYHRRCALLGEDCTLPPALEYRLLGTPKPYDVSLYQMSYSFCGLRKVKIKILRSIILTVLPLAVDVQDRRIENVREQDVTKLFESWDAESDAKSTKFHNEKFCYPKLSSEYLNIEDHYVDREVDDRYYQDAYLLGIM